MPDVVRGAAPLGSVRVRTAALLGTGGPGRQSQQALFLLRNHATDASTRPRGWVRQCFHRTVGRAYDRRVRQALPR